MAEFMTGLKRTHYCGDLRISDVDKEVTVCGWVQRCRDLGQLIFIDLRDRTGVVQLAFNDKTDKEIFDKAFPQSGFFSLNHNDTLRLNLLLKDEKILIIDHEYGGLTLRGFDIVNYVVETNFDGSPSYEFYPNEIDLKAYYEIFVKFLNAFEKSEKHSYFVNSEEGKNEIKKYKSFEYFTNLVILDNILWFVFAMIYFDYEKIVNGKSFNYFQHAFDRVTYYNAVKEFIGMEIEDKVDI